MLSSFLGQYVKAEAFSPTSLETSLTQGNLKLSNLELKTDAFDWMLLPMRLSIGFIGCVEVTIPWTTALSDQAKVCVDIDKVLLVFVAKSDWTGEERERRAQMHKQSRLTQAELVKRSREAVLGIGRGESVDASNLSARLVARLLSKLEIKIRRVQIRFEAKSGPGVTSFGLSLGSFKVTNADDAVVADANEPSKLCAMSGTCRLLFRKHIF